jgi:hypothetical protein
MRYERKKDKLATDEDDELFRWTSPTTIPIPFQHNEDDFLSKVNTAGLPLMGILVVVNIRLQNYLIFSTKRKLLMMKRIITTMTNRNLLIRSY